MEFRGMTLNEFPINREETDPLPVIQDLDKFLKTMYEYYANKGLGVILLSEICSILSLGFTVFFTTFLIGIFNWSALYDCYDEMSCTALSSYLLTNPFHEKPNSFRFMVTMYFLLLFFYWIYSCKQSVNKINEAWEMESFYRDFLKVGFNDIENYQWYEVVEKFIDLYEDNQLPFSCFPLPPSQQPHPHSVDHSNTTNATENIPQMTQKPSLTIPQIILRIMRKENYFIALVNKNKLDLYLPWWISPYTTEQVFLTKTMEWSLNFCLFDHMFYLHKHENPFHHRRNGIFAQNNTPFQNEQAPQEVPPNSGVYELSNQFVNDVDGLITRFQWTGFILFLIMPFTFLYLLMNFILENTSSFHFSKAYLGPRIWTPLTLWQFREFNELNHIFQKRMNSAYQPTEEYLLSFRNHYLMVIGKFLAYISGSFITILIILSLLNEELLMYYELWNHNLLWFLGIFSAIYAISNSSLFLDSANQNKTFQPRDVLLSKMYAFTHYYPDHWRGREHTTLVSNEISELLVYKVQLLLMELSGVILTPLILCFSLPKCAPSLLQFIK
jgi:autophagy-related protein 9